MDELCFTHVRLQTRSANEVEKNPIACASLLDRRIPHHESGLYGPVRGIVLRDLGGEKAEEPARRVVDYYYV